MTEDLSEPEGMASQRREDLPKRIKKGLAALTKIRIVMEKFHTLSKQEEWIFVIFSNFL